MSYNEDVLNELQGLDAVAQLSSKLANKMKLKDKMTKMNSIDEEVS